MYQQELEATEHEQREKLQLSRLQNMVDYRIARSSFYKTKLQNAGVDSGRCIETLKDIGGI